MRFECEDQIPFRAEDVFDEALGGQVALGELLPDVERVEPVSARRRDTYRWERIDRWTARSAHRGPSASWLVTSLWDRRRLDVRWHIDALEPRDGADAQGVMTFAPQRAGDTLVTFAWDITLMGYALPLPTRALSIALAPQAERAAADVVERNVAAMLGGVEGRLASCAALGRAS